jgi:hypothetical protein
MADLPMSPRRTAAAAVAAGDGGDPANGLASGVPIYSRILAAGDLVVTLRGPDHNFVGAAPPRRSRRRSNFFARATGPRPKIRMLPVSTAASCGRACRRFGPG